MMDGNSPTPNERSDDLEASIEAFLDAKLKGNDLGNYRL